MAAQAPGGDGRARLGFLGGAFNPPHIGHLVLAHEARWQLGLESVTLVPYGEAPHKRIAADAGRAARMEMTRLAVHGVRSLTASSSEVEREGPSYSFETLEMFAREHPDAELVLILGADAAAGLEGWERPERLLELARLGVAGRAGIGEAELSAALERAGAGERVIRFEMPEVAVSSTFVRERAAAGGPVGHLVPAAVAGYIEREGLYR